MGSANTISMNFDVNARADVMAKTDGKFSPDKFKCFVRYMLLVAKQKRCVTYSELENVFGLSHDQAGHYCRMLGDYCLDRQMPLLNGLVINSNTCKPSTGFRRYEQLYCKSWGEVVSKCWKFVHVSSTRKQQVKDFSERDKDVERFLTEHNGSPGPAK